MDDFTKCARCGTRPTVLGPEFGMFTVVCDNCYDGAPDSDTRNEFGISKHLPDAVADWETRVRDAVAEGVQVYTVSTLPPPRQMDATETALVGLAAKLLTDVATEVGRMLPPGRATFFRAGVMHGTRCALIELKWTLGYLGYDDAAAAIAQLLEALATAAHAADAYQRQWRAAN